MADHYQPQGKVMFSEASVCSWGRLGRPPSLEADTPLGRPPLGRSPSRQAPSRQTPSRQTLLGTHPTGMHSCFWCEGSVCMAALTHHIRAHSHLAKMVANLKWSNDKQTKNSKSKRQTSKKNFAFASGFVRCVWALNLAYTEENRVRK